MSSELLAAVSEATGVPEAMVERSAQARAAADGVSPEEVLAAWSGNGAVTPSAPSAAVPEPAPQPVAPETQDETPAPTPTPEPAPSPEPAAPVREPTAVAVLTAPEGSPVLEGRRESGVALLVGAFGLFLVAVFFSFVLPALDVTPASPPPSGLSELGLEGREIYIAEGCWYCHTQQVRPIVTDAKLGSVTQPDQLASIAPDTLGLQRIGPDLARSGSREPTDDAAWLTNFLTDPRSVREDSLQPAYSHLAEADVAALAQYLLESK